ncbi:hypothetical protein AGOR_G00193450 [Albula goreensis]|uniref:E3 ubiquitin-protein ligase MARCH1 n=1 Tax=Albula goreensis TaxID=1534307 RepID=A0A8T3CZ90_9TELE|nr:hypothetical protein AGOR_G00193450 [Albula goreensis]
MPVHQISVVPARETTSNGRNSNRNKDKNKETESEKAPRRSGSRSSNISKASSSTTGLGHTSVSRTSVTPSSQDICSSSGPLPKVEEDRLEQSTSTPVTVLTRSGQQQVGKRQVKRRHRRKRDCSQGCECCNTESVHQGAEKDQKGSSHQKECSRHRGAGSHRGDIGSSSSDEDQESWRQARSWSRERARRSRRRSNSSREREKRSRGMDDNEAMELVSVGSDEGLRGGKENQAPGSTELAHTGLKNRRKVSAKKGDRQPRPAEVPANQHRKSGSFREVLTSGRSPGSSSPHEGDHITKMYEECGSGEEAMSASTTGRRSACQNGVTQQHQHQHQQCSDDELEVCRICHCEGDEECPLITPCRCTGSLRFVHQGCLHQWIKSSDTRCCELCKYDFIMETQLKPLRKWEKLQMSTSERRKIICSVTFHIIAVTCVVWSLYVLIDRTAEEIKQGKENGVLEWPFWTKLIVVAIGFTGGLIFMYIQCKVYLQLWRRLKAFNRIIFVQNCPDTIKKGEEKTLPLNQTNGRHDSVEVPVSQTETNCHRPAGDAGVPEVAPV